MKNIASMASCGKSEVQILNRANLHSIANGSPTSMKVRVVCSPGISKIFSKSLMFYRLVCVTLALDIRKWVFKMHILSMT